MLLFTAATGDQGLYTWYFKCSQCFDIDIVWDMSQYGSQWKGISYDDMEIQSCNELEIHCEQCDHWFIINFHEKQLVKNVSEIDTDVHQFGLTLDFYLDKVFICDNVITRQM